MSFKIIISPAKKITDKNDFTHPFTSLLFVSEAGRLHNYLKSLDFSQLKKIYQASDKITSEMMDVNNRFAADKGFLHALYAYDGIQYKTMAPGIMDDASIAYLADHLFIVSGLYGRVVNVDGLGKIGEIDAFPCAGYRDEVLDVMAFDIDKIHVALEFEEVFVFALVDSRDLVQLVLHASDTEDIGIKNEDEHAADDQKAHGKDPDDLVFRRHEVENGAKDEDDHNRENNDENRA